MAEPQPPAVQEGAAEPHAPTGTADDRKAAAALSTLDAQDDSGMTKEVDGKALDKAVKGLSIKDTKSDEKKNVKVELADVNLLVCASVEQVLVGMTDCADQGARFEQAESYGLVESVRWQRGEGHDCLCYGYSVKGARDFRT
jgi:hypothetical protein